MLFADKVVIKLQKEYYNEIDGKSYSEITLDFGKATGRLQIETEKKVTGGRGLTVNQDGIASVLVPHQSMEYCGIYASVLAALPYKFLLDMRPEDFNAIWSTVSAFIQGNNPQEFYNEFSGADVAVDPEDSPGFLTDKA